MARHEADRCGRLEVVGVIIGRGANPTVQDNYGETPLHSSSREEQLEVIGVLIEHGPDLTAKNKDRETPLHVASRERQQDVVGMLIWCGADLTAQDKDGTLHYMGRHEAGDWRSLECSSSVAQMRKPRVTSGRLRYITH